MRLNSGELGDTSKARYAMCFALPLFVIDAASTVALLLLILLQPSTIVC